MKLKGGDYIVFFESQIIGDNIMTIKKNKKYKIELLDETDEIFHVLTEDQFPWFSSIKREGKDFKRVTKYNLENFL